MLGTLIGDIIGSVYEFKNCRRKDFTPLFHPQARFTDDTVCTVAIADALVRGADPQVTLIEWCRRYAENGGWGQRFAQWFMDDNAEPYGSWGNGAAMRISPVGYLATSEEEVVAWSDRATMITHNHPEAVTSARAVALAVYWGRNRVTPGEITTRITERFRYDLSTTPDDIRPRYVRTERAADSVPQAMICGLQSLSYEDAIRNAISIGGDSDTIAAIAGGIAEAIHGLPAEIARCGWSFLPPDMQRVMNALYGLQRDQIGRHREARAHDETGTSNFSHGGRVDAACHLGPNPGPHAKKQRTAGPGDSSADELISIAPAPVLREPQRPQVESEKDSIRAEGLRRERVRRMAQQALRRFPAAPTTSEKVDSEDSSTDH